MSEPTKEHRDCLAKGFPFWNDLTPDEQDMLCRYTRPVHYAKGARVHSPLESCVGILLLRSGNILTNIVRNIKLVPHLGCNLLCFFTFSIVSLCSFS